MPDVVAAGTEIAGVPVVNAGFGKAALGLYCRWIGWHNCKLQEADIPYITAKPSAKQL